MIGILHALALGFAFALGISLGISLWIYIKKLITPESKFEKLQMEILNHHKRVEDRLSTQVATMAACLEVIKNKQKNE